MAADHLAVGEDQGCRDQEHREHLDEVREARWVLERVRGVGIEDAATVGAEQLDRFLRGDRPHRDRLCEALDPVEAQVVREVLNRAL
jgi:transposase